MGAVVRAPVPPPHISLDRDEVLLVLAGRTIRVVDSAGRATAVRLMTVDECLANDRANRAALVASGSPVRIPEMTRQQAEAAVRPLILQPRMLP